MPLRRFAASRLPPVAYIETTFAGRDQAGNRVRTAGTGTLIGPRIILTAGHVVFEPLHGDEQFGGRPLDIVVTLGSTRITLKAVDWRTTNKWINVDSGLPAGDVRRLLSNADVGLVVLQDAIDTQVAPLSHVETTPTETLNTATLNVAGYSNQLPDHSRSGTLFGGKTSGGGVVARAPSRVTYPLETLAGMSGGPVWTFDRASESRTLRGIHTSILNGAGNALRITSEVFKLVSKWSQEFHPTASN